MTVNSSSGFVEAKEVKGCWFLERGDGEWVGEGEDAAVCAAGGGHQRSVHLRHGVPNTHSATRQNRYRRL